jgi:hypothetical protein
MNDTDQIGKDWDDELRDSFGWMGGGWLHFECRSGWKYLLKDVLTRIDLTLDEDERKTFHITQIKEKFGTLSIYHNGGQHISMLTGTAQQASSHVCDICGRLGRPRGGSYIATRCDEHEGVR